jgi:hypothetical protein
MSRLVRVAAVIAFALAYLSQPLALDACAVSCEAALAARTPAVAPPCHHPKSCATQISQPTPSGSTAIDYTLALPMAAVAVDCRAGASTVASRSCLFISSISPPISTPLRV